MNLYPTDLGEQITRQVKSERSHLLAVPGTGMQPNTAGGLGLGGLALTGILWALCGLGLAIFMGCLTALCFIGYGYLAMNALNTDESLQRPLSSYEVQSMRERAQDPLLNSYLALAYSVINLPPTNDETANREVRDAITALGVAVEALPPEQQVVTEDPAALRAEAQIQIENAHLETDAVIAASRRRRAESLLRRADTSARTLLLLRRNRALREEVAEQIKALQTSLTALQVGGRQSAPELSGLAASIHRVALEANAVTVARAEVDTLLNQPQISAEDPTTQGIQLSAQG